MRICGYTYSFHTAIHSGEMDTVDVVHYIRELGLNAIEIYGMYVTEEQVPRIRAALENANVGAACYDLFCVTDFPDATRRRAAVAKAVEELDWVATLAAPRVLIIPGFPKPEYTHAQAREWFTEALHTLVPEAKQRGITPMLANVGWQPVVYGTSDQLLAACEAVGPDLKLVYDVGNFFLAGEDNLRALQRVAGRMEHVHLKDWVEVARDAPNQDPFDFADTNGTRFTGELLGDGVLDLRAALRELRRLNYKGYVSIEYEGHKEPKNATRKGVEYVRALLDKLA
jgi:sugar phosphate isomerase/epimerase